MKNGLIVDDDGTSRWYRNDYYHRLEGPAIIYKVEVIEIERWYLNGVFQCEEDHPFNIFRVEYDLSKDYQDWPDEYKVLFKLIYG